MVIGAGVGTTLAIGYMLTTLAAVAAASYSVYSGYQQARASRAQGKAQQRMAEYNAEVLEQQAAAERLAGRKKEEFARVRATQVRQRHRYLKAKQQVQFAKAGVVAGEGTPLLVASEEAMQGKLQGLEEIWKGKLEKREHFARASALGAQAGASRMQGQWAKDLASSRAKGYILSGWVKGGTGMLGALGSGASALGSLASAGSTMAAGGGSASGPTGQQNFMNTGGGPSQQYYWNTGGGL